MDRTTLRKPSETITRDIELPRGDAKRKAMGHLAETEQETKEMGYTWRDGKNGHKLTTVAVLSLWPMFPMSKQEI